MELDFRKELESYTYKNRDGDLIKFSILDDKTTCEVSNFFTGCLRIIEEENSAKVKKDNPLRDKNIFAIDLSGGPFIGKGMDLHDFLFTYDEFLKQSHKKIIKKISLQEDKIILEYEENPIKNHPDNLKEKSSKETV